MSAAIAAAVTRVLGYWLNDADLAEACRRRADELGKSYDEIDALANLAKGHTSKVLSVPQQQGFGPISRFAIPWALEMKFGLVEDPDSARKCKRRVDHAVRRGSKHHRNAKALAFVQKWGRQGSRKALENMGKDGISKQRSKASRARWKHVRRKRAASKAAKVRWSRPRIAKVMDLRPLTAG